MLAQPTGIARSASSERLRSDIDRGRTGDKVAWPDPAAAPLGTDEEAAGIPVPPHAAEAAHRLETQNPSRRPRRSGFGHAWLLIAFAFVLAIAFIYAGVGRG